MNLPADPFGRIADPRARLGEIEVEAERWHRVELIAEVARALLDGRVPEAEARGLVGGALSAWLQQGGNLERNFLRVQPRRGSKVTPAAIASALNRHRDDAHVRDVDQQHSVRDHSCTSTTFPKK